MLLLLTPRMFLLQASLSSTTSDPDPSDGPSDPASEIPFASVVITDVDVVLS